MRSARKLRDQKLLEPVQQHKTLPKKRSSRAVDDDSEESVEFIQPTSTRSNNRSSSRQDRIGEESATKSSAASGSGNKRQKRDSDQKSQNIHQDENQKNGAEKTSPFKLSQTAQSDENEEQQYLSQTATRSTRVSHSLQSQHLSQRAQDPTAYQSPTKPDAQIISTGKNMDNYLNEENLKHLERISKQVKLDFNFFTKELIKELDSDHKQRQEGSNGAQIENISDKLRRIEGKAELNIEGLQQSTTHIQRNKLSDKFSRREMQFFDLYIKKEDEEELAQLKEAQFPLDIDAEQYYQEMEIDDFTSLFENQCIVEERFGKTIKVTLSKNNNTYSITRRVLEFPELVRIRGPHRDSSDYNQSQLKQAVDQKDPELLSIHASLKQFEKEYGKSHEEIAEIFCKVSGRLNKMKDYLENRPVIEWSYLEDLAIQKSDESAEFQILLQTKGWEEIMIRRDFLHASPLISEEEVKQ